MLTSYLLVSQSRLQSLACSVSCYRSNGSKGLNWGVDFAGGTEIMLGFDSDVESKELSGSQ